MGTGKHVQEVCVPSQICMHVCCVCTTIDYLWYNCRMYARDITVYILVFGLDEGVLPVS